MPAHEGLDLARDAQSGEARSAAIIGVRGWRPLLLCCNLPPNEYIFIADLASFEEGKLFDSYFLILGRQLRTTQSNKPISTLILCDKTGQMEGRAWEPADPRIARDFDRGDIAKVRGCIQRFNDRLQMKVDQLRKAHPHEVEKSDFMPATTYDVEALWTQLLSYVESFTDPHLKLLLSTISFRPGDRCRVSRGAGRQATAPRLAGRPAGTRDQPVAAGRPCHGSLPHPVPRPAAQPA